VVLSLETSANRGEGDLARSRLDVQAHHCQMVRCPYSDASAAMVVVSICMREESEETGVFVPQSILIPGCGDREDERGVNAAGGQLARCVTRS